MNQKAEQLKSLTSLLVDSDRPAHSLRPEVVQLKAILESSQTVRLTACQDISEGETQTPNGLALSPTMAAMCADDFMRTIAFMRATHDAIVDQRKRTPDRPVNVLYVGCGPYATLAVPLMTVFPSSEAVFTLLDIHSESIASVKSVADTLCLSESIADFVNTDAGAYRIDRDQPPDIILVELMQACLESEPQVAIARHLLPQAPNAVLIPEEVSVDLVLVDPSREFDLDSPDREERITQRARIPVGQVFVLNREAITSWKRNFTNRLPASTVQIPDSVEPRYQLMLFTNIRVYRNQALKDYDSGLTSPRTLSHEGPINAGDSIRFHYELGSRPGLRNPA